MSSNARMKLDVLLLHQLSGVIERDHVSPSGKDWHSIPCSFRCARGCESAPGKLGNNSTRGGLLLRCELLGCLEDIIIDINCSAHASDAIASSGYVKTRPRLCLFTLSVLLLSNCGVTGDPKLIGRRHDIARRNTAAFSRARAHS